MNNLIIKRVHLFFSPLFILLLHLPFVFAKVKPVHNEPVITVSNVADYTSPVISTPVINEASFITTIYDSLKLASTGLSRQVFEYALNGFEYLKAKGKIDNPDIISIADLSKSSCKKRLFIIDLKNYKVLFNTYVAHGMNSGQEFAKHFSNVPESNKTSLGFYETSNTYNGKNGYSMHLIGLEKGINDNAYNRDIVMHGAGYVSENLIHAMGYLGRSQGCPAVPEKQHKKIIDKIKNGTCLFIFGDDRNYFRRSAVVKNTMPLLASR
ncbi:MAG: murein L,D-transpeptidase catalytic domain family protein [Bacteroidota bacterium]